MLYYVNINKKRVVGRNNQQSTRPITLEYDVTEVIDFQFIDDNNQIQPLSPQTAGLTLAIGLKQNMPSYDLLALSRDYTIEDNILKFDVNCYTTNWLKKINKPNTEVFIEISQQSLESKKVWMRDYCYVWPRVYTAGLEPEEIQSKDYWTASETQEYVDNAIEEATSGIVISGYVTEEQFEEGLATKQNVIDADNKLDYELLSGTPTIPTKTSDLENDSDFITEDALSGYATETALTGHTSDTTIHVTAEDKAAWSGKQDAITVDNKLDYALLSGTPEVPTVEWGGISGTLSAQTDLQNALNGKANASDIPLSTSQLTNDSGFVTSSVMEDALSGKQDLITESEWLPATYVRMDIDHWQGDPDFDVAAAVNMTRDDVYAVSGVVSGLLSSKQDAITNDNKLDYSLLSGTPSIPLSTSELINDSDFQTSTDVANAISGKAEQTDVAAISGELVEVEEVLDNYTLFNGPFYVMYDGDEIAYTNVRVLAQGTPTVAPSSLQYSFDKKTWTNYTLSDGLTLNSSNPIVYFRSTAPNTFFTDNNNFYKIYSSGSPSGTVEVKVGGNVMSLIKPDYLDDVKISTSLNRLFYNETRITDASNLNLPATILDVDSVYSNMFSGCTKLKKAPKLPATTIRYNCYGGMFNGCTALTDAPELPATQLANYCYNWMFNNCSSLSAAPELPANTAATYCYQRMFQGCTSLVNPPKMELTTVAQGCCDVMFWNCSKLETAPYLPATTLAQGCYGGMFNSCTSLKSISAEFTSWNSGNSTGNWVYNVNASGNFYCPSTLPVETGNARIPVS